MKWGWNGVIEKGRRRSDEIRAHLAFNQSCSDKKYMILSISPTLFSLVNRDFFYIIIRYTNNAYIVNNFETKEVVASGDAE